MVVQSKFGILPAVKSKGRGRGREAQSYRLHIIQIIVLLMDSVLESEDRGSLIY